METKIEKFTLEDFDDYYRLVGDKKVMAMITERALPLDEAKAEFERRIENNKLQDDFGSFKIVDGLSKEFVGLAKLEIEEKNSEEAELGYMILPEYWGKGIAGRMAKQLVEVARAHPTLKKIFAFVDPNNIPSKKILTNNGFVHKEFKDFDGLPGEVLELKLK